MNRFDLISMFLLGFLGTGHCIGMCGPLVLAIPTQVGGFSSHLLYHLGRITTYTIIGAFLGAVGSAFESVTAAGLQNHFPMLVLTQVGFSMLAAGFMLIFGLSRLAVIGEPSWMSTAAPMKVPGFAKLMRSVLGSRKPLAMLPVGLMMGFLPCGISYAAFARALPSGGWLTGMLLVAAFGLGTAPGLLFIGTVASEFARRYRKQSDIISGILMIILALSVFLHALGKAGHHAH